MKTQLIALSTLFFLSTLSGALAATMEDKPMSSGMDHSMPAPSMHGGFPETMSPPAMTQSSTKPMAAEKKKGAAMGKKKTPMMKKDRAPGSMEPMKNNASDTMMPKQ